MQTATSVSVILLRITAIIQIVLGLLFWTGNLLSLVSLHMVVGFILVLCLWALSGLGAASGVNPGLVALGFAWGLVVPVLGVTQARILPGDLHWIVQVAHLLVGLIAIGIGDNLLAPRIRENLPTPVAA